MAAGRYNIIIEQGASFSKSLSLTDSDSLPWDLSGYSQVRGQIRRHYNSESAAATFVLAINGDGTAGTISWGLSPAQTLSLEAADHLYDIELVADDGEVTRLLEGTVTVRPNITR